MLEKLKSVLTWPVVVLFVSGLTAFVLITLYAPADVRTALFGAHGLLFTIIALMQDPPGSAPPPPAP